MCLLGAVNGTYIGLSELDHEAMCMYACMYVGGWVLCAGCGGRVCGGSVAADTTGSGGGSGDGGSD